MIIKKIISAITELGIKKNDVVLMHVDTDICRDNNIKLKQHCSNILESIFSVIGRDGTLIVPSFTYSFCQTGIFDSKKTMSVVGYFSNFMLNHKDSFRSLHPIFSFVAIGKHAKDITNNISTDAFGKDSIFDRLLKMRAKGLFLNLPIVNPGSPPSTFLHYLEQYFKVDYRYIKKFPGAIINEDKRIEDTFLYNVRNYDLDIRTDNLALYYQSIKNGCMRTMMIDDKLPVCVCEINGVFDTGMDMLKNNKYALLEKNPYT